ncbi:hypothetical protein [Actinacidiphila bryophytorum]|uniref:hypothetical protein n=1 Tax=Actinacidiphila bryophytorum TaxID=1436133 RepID=UPI002176D74B|nr:hypothetical protein [Actinacidiphila bryophytorum]UWE12051.1 hypothetical protein NYE86_27400 [Actinacidiphila bryophytorum]
MVRVSGCVIACLASVTVASCGDRHSPPVGLLIDGPRGAGTWQHPAGYEQDSGSTAFRRWTQRGDDFSQTVHVYLTSRDAAAAFRHSPPERDEVYQGAKEYSIGARMTGADQVDYKCGTWNDRSQCITWWAWARYGRYTVELTYRRATRSTDSLTDPQLALMITNAGTDVAEKYRAVSASSAGGE